MASFSAGGLASGIDTNAIVDSLVKLETRPLDLLHNRQDALRNQVSLLGDLSSKLASFKTAMAALSSGGALGVSVGSSNTAFTAKPGATAASGSYSLSVTALATAAKQRSQAYATSSSPVTGGTLSLGVKGTTTNVVIVDGTPLDQVALQINQSGAAVNAVVISDGTSSYLSLTNRDTGFPVGSAASSALTATMTVTGTAGAPLATTSVNTATNASFELDGLAITRQSNTVTDAVPGVTLTLKALSPTAAGVPVPETLELGSDADATAKNLASMITAYNDLLKAVQKQVSVAPGANRAATLAGDSTVRGLARGLQGLVTTQVAGMTDVRTLADLGLKTAQDGTISLDSAVLAKAVARNPGAVNQLFSQAGTGLSVATTTLVDGYINSTDGLLSSRSSGITKNISQLDRQAGQMQLRIDNFKKNLIAQFTAMESVVSGLKSIGNFLTSQSAANDKS